MRKDSHGALHINACDLYLVERNEVEWSDLRQHQEKEETQRAEDDREDQEEKARALWWGSWWVIANHWI